MGIKESVDLVEQVDPKQEFLESDIFTGTIEEGRTAFSRDQRDRMNVVLHVYHRQIAMKKTTQVTIKCTKFIEHKEEAYQRTTKVVGSDWKQVDYHWFNDDLDTVGAVVIENKEGTYSMKTGTTQEQIDLEATRDLLISFDGKTPAQVLMPQQGTVIYPIDGARFYVSSKADLTRYTITVIPN